MRSETSESPITTRTCVALARADLSRPHTTIRGLWLLLACFRQRSRWVHVHIECAGKALVIGPAQSFVVDGRAIDRVWPIAERIEVPIDRPEDVLNCMAGAITWVRVGWWQNFICWATRGRCGADCVSVTRHILQSAGVPVPDKVRRVKELREWLYRHTSTASRPPS